MAVPWPNACLNPRRGIEIEDLTGLEPYALQPVYDRVVKRPRRFVLERRGKAAKYVAAFIFST